MDNNNSKGFYRSTRCITRQQKIKILEAVKKQSMNLQNIKTFAGMEFYSKANLSLYNYEDARKDEILQFY
ncbi:MAG: hypothetical protein ABIP35_04430 [Ginsengibacter sp.]